MPVWPDLRKVIEQLRELDVGALRGAAETPPRVVVLGAANRLRDGVIAALLQGPGGPLPAQASLETLNWPALPEALTPLREAELVLLLPSPAASTRQVEQELIARLQQRQVAVAVIRESGAEDGWFGAPVVRFDVAQPDAFGRQMALGLAATVPIERWPALGRHLPGLRDGLTERLIATTAQNNAIYALSTGLAEVIPVFDIPFNVADMVILTKNQALLAYKVALLYGLPGEPQQALTELASVVGSGFLWRQVARQLVGLVPVWGIIPKTVVAYAGTYVTGEAVRVWCASGRRLERKALNQLYHQATLQGKALAQRLSQRLPQSQRGLTWPKLRLPWSRRGA
ncbi:hypothetical protein [Candidatus Amarolinea dominans]|uniref:hypothetical protein n=1 Tax=Candidatus Amarolinea dominans TaxID=3140696 RepID=UPI001DC5FF53|nr:hypothetical protein [Anaerolineae bacterium]MBK7201294.1 hypothetical protein [Anaerolineae bacterium]MBK9233923.1 hypothetical protein [Anaerolineae bacterium]